MIRPLVTVALTLALTPTGCSDEAAFAHTDTIEARNDAGQVLGSLDP